LRSFSLTGWSRAECIIWDRWNAATLGQLTAGQIGVDYPELESLGMMEKLDDELLLELHLRLPNLTALAPGTVTVENPIALITALPNLRTLSVDPRYVEHSAWLFGLAEALPMGQLTSLTLSSTALTDEHLAAIVQGAGHLQSLTVEQGQLRSLRCFAETPHLARTLERLHLNRPCGSIPASELVHLRALRSLCALHLFCLYGSIPSAVAAAMTPADRDFALDVWPNLDVVRFEGDVMQVEY